MVSIFDAVWFAGAPESHVVSQERGLPHIGPPAPWCPDSQVTNRVFCDSNRCKSLDVRKGEMVIITILTGDLV